MSGSNLTNSAAGLPYQAAVQKNNILPECKLSEDRNTGNQCESALQAINVSKGNRIVLDCVEWAGTSEKRRRGLLGRSGLDSKHGIYIVPSQCIHTFRMKFSIDVAFIASDGRVVAVQHDLKPNRISKLIFRAEGILELASGRLRETDTEVGDIVRFCDRLKTGEG
jgi:uncharacterized membrane protein (UPF0127 family)